MKRMKKGLSYLLTAIIAVVALLPIATTQAQTQQPPVLQNPAQQTQAQPTSTPKPAPDIMRMDSRRALSLGKCYTVSQLPADVQALLSDFPQYQNESSLNGMSETTASEVGWDTVAVLNEVPGSNGQPDRFCYTLLRPRAKVATLNGDPKPLRGYLYYCRHDTILNFKNRIIVPPPKLVHDKGDTVELPCKEDEQGMTLRAKETLPNGDLREVWSDNCHESVKITTKPITNTSFVAACPAGIKAEGDVRFWKDKVFGGKLKAAASVGATIFADKVIRGRDWGGTFEDAGLTLAVQRGEQFFNASDSFVKIKIPGSSKVYEVNKGENTELAHGLSTLWAGRTVFIVARPDGYAGDQGFICGAGALKEGSNLALVTNGDTNVITPTKTLPEIGSPVPIRPRVFLSYVPQTTPLTLKEFTTNPRYGYSGILSGGEPTFNSTGLAFASAPSTNQRTSQPKIRVASNMQVVEN